MVNNRVYLDSIVGSNSFNLQTDKSDIDEYILFKGDVVFVDSIEKDKKIDYHFTNVNNFLNKLYSKETIHNEIQLFTPFEIVQQSDVQDFLINTRESWVKANQYFVLSSFFRKGESILGHFEDSWKIYPKQLMTAARLLHTICCYSKNNDWRSASFIKEEDRSFFFDIRQKKLSKENTYDKLLKLKNAAQECLSKICEDDNKKYNEYWIKNMRALLEIDR